MGEAKRRGTFKERKAVAIAKAKKILKDKPIIHRSRSRKSINQIDWILALASGISTSGDIPFKPTFKF